MNEKVISAKPPKSFYWIAGAAFVWDLLGVMAYISTVTVSPEALAALPEAQRELMANTPAWSTGLFAIAVWGGVIGTLLLLLRKAFALPVLIVSLAAVVINGVYTWFMTNALEVMGVGQAMFAAVIFAIAAFLVWFANDAKGKGWIN
ncbi:MAG: hypothetical protein OEM63_05900 [Gammaproteobacteria bacterium]|nr:hypothetical protein [Gammaproteobacteria bacterium]